MAVLDAAVIAAAKAARDAYLTTVDPNYMRAAPVVPAPGNGPPPAPPQRGANGAPPPPSHRPAQLLRPDLYGDTFFDTVFELLKGEKAILASASAVLDYAQWFNYFLTEARMAKNVPTRDIGCILAVVVDLGQLLQPSGRALARRSTFACPAALAPGFSGLLGSAPGGVPHAILDYLLNLGFVHYSPEAAGSARMWTEGPGVGGAKIEHYFGPTFGLKCALQQQPANRDLKDGFLFFYRGDSRDPKTVKDQAGAKCRADLKQWRDENGIDLPWHPWNATTSLSDRMWLRVGNADNDYYTVNSIAMDFHISCAYPMLKLGEIDPNLTGHPADWSDEKKLLLRKKTKRADVFTARNNKRKATEVVLVDRGRVYICAFPADTKLSPTTKLNTYPEQGVRTVPLEQIIAWFEIERYHNNDALRAAGKSKAELPVRALYESTTPGSTMTVKILNWGWMDVTNGGKNSLALANPAVLEQRLSSYVGMVFEIDHNRLIGLQTTFDPATKQKHWPVATNNSVRI